jgi:hypothetical protein
MPTFTRGAGADRKVVRLEVQGQCVVVTENKADGGTKRSEKAMKSEADARTACDRMARELITLGFVEAASPAPARPKPAPARPKPAPTATPAVGGGLDLGSMLDDEEPVDESAPVLERLSAPPARPGAEAEPKKKKKKSGRKKKRQAAEDTGALDKRVIALALLAGVAFLGYVGFLVADSLRPPSLVGIWSGSRLEYEYGSPMTFDQYRLVIKDRKQAEMGFGGDSTAKGTYSVKGDRIKLALKDEEGGEFDQEYKFSLGHATLDLYDTESGKKVVQLVRQDGKPAAGGPPPAPKAPEGVAAGPADKDADSRLASVEFTPKDGAFKVRHPEGWKPETGSRPDNTYSWARFTKGSGKIQVYADVQGSLMSGSDFAQQPDEPGSELAPVHTAHDLYKRTASEEYSDYNESEPTLFEGSQLGEGRISTFTASGGFLGGKIRGYRVTLLTRNRRVSILCECPEGDFEKFKPTFLAVCRSVSN